MLSIVFMQVLVYSDSLQSSHSFAIWGVWHFRPTSILVVPLKFEVLCTGEVNYHLHYEQYDKSCRFTLAKKGKAMKKCF